MNPVAWLLGGMACLEALGNSTRTRYAIRRVRSVYELWSADMGRNHEMKWSLANHDIGFCGFLLNYGRVV